MSPNALNPMLLTMLACPSDDHAPLREETHDGADTLVCTFCGTRFPVDDGIPVLLLDDATPGPNGVGVAAGGASAAAAEPAAEDVPEPVGAVPAVEVAQDEVVAPEVVAPEVVAPEVGPAVGGASPGLPFDPRVSPKHALPDGLDDTGPGDPVEVLEAAQAEGVFDTAEVERAAEDAELETAEVVDVADVVEVADVLVDDDVAPGDGAFEPADEADVAAPVTSGPAASPTADARRPQSPPPGARTIAAALRNRVEHRLAEYEANRGPRRRRGTGR